MEITVSEFAQKLGKSPGYVSRIEVRGEIPSTELLIEIAEILGIEPEKLVSEAKSEHIDRSINDIETKYSEAIELYRKTK